MKKLNSKNQLIEKGERNVGYKIETGEMFACDPESGQFLPLGGQRPPVPERMRAP